MGQEYQVDLDFLEKQYKNIEEKAYFFKMNKCIVLQIIEGN
ncbi:hypothetical protein [Maledivibacter halophilus]|nr:hypothetical protein [Maledivibacter halophilus]